MAMEGLLALIGGLLGGYGQGRQTGLDNRLRQQQADEAAQEFQVRTALERAAQDAQRNQFGQDLDFRKQQADAAQKQFGQELASRGVMALPAFVKNLKGTSDTFARGATGAYSAAFPGANLPVAGAADVGPDVESAQGQAGLMKTISDIEQGAVGASSAQQKAIGEANNSLRKSAGLPEQPVPFAPTGQVRRVAPDFEQLLGGLLAGSPDQPSTYKEFDVLNPGFSPSPETAARQAQTHYVNTEASTLPQKVQAEVAKLRQEGQFKQADLLLQAAKLQSDNANAAANRAVTERGQNISAATAANGQATTERGQDLTFAGRTADQAAQDRRAAQVQIDGIAKQRDTTLTTLRGYQAILTSGMNAKTGKPLSDAETTTLQSMSRGLEAQVRQHNDDIRALKEQNGIIPPRDGATGQFVSPTQRVPAGAGSTFTKSGRAIKTSSGRTLVVTPVN